MRRLKYLQFFHFLMSSYATPATVRADQHEGWNILQNLVEFEEWRGGSVIWFHRAAEWGNGDAQYLTRRIYNYVFGDQKAQIVSGG